MPIYLDNHATTPVDPRVLEAMLPYFRDRFGNSSSRSHKLGWEADEAVEKARDQVARLLGANAREIVFTSGATESNNLALLGIMEAHAGRGNHLVVSPLEHPAVRDAATVLAGRGCDVTWLTVDAGGRVRPEEVAAALTDRTVLVSVMTANNEVGTVQPVREIGAICEERKVFFHTDATQGVTKIAFDVVADHVHLASLTAHKIYGPKGCGALYVRRGVEVARQVHGGGQERGMRPGTLNVPGIVGLGAACELGRLEREQEAEHCGRLRDRLQARLFDAFDDLVLNGDPADRLPGNLHVSFPGVDSQSLMLAVPEVAVSAGAACASDSIEPSHVMAALGVGAERAGSSIRFGIGRFNTEAEVDEAAERFIAAARKLRKKVRR